MALKEMQFSLPSCVVMVRPQTFISNPETRSSNAFQVTEMPEIPLQSKTITSQAQSEFDRFQRLLMENGIGVLSFSEDQAAQTPDALFPNNWFVHLPDGRVFLMPMYAENRRREYRQDIIEVLRPSEVIDLRPLAAEGLFLEGTGSLILDHQSKTGYACRSLRTSDAAVKIFSEHSGYRILVFDSVDHNGQPVYHTNVMMALSPDLAVVNLSSVADKLQRHELISQLGREVIDISHTQMQSFAGNMLFLQNRQGQRFWVCSDKARASLTADQSELMQRRAEFISADLRTIETYGGGGARCLLAEMFSC